MEDTRTDRDLKLRGIAFIRGGFLVDNILIKENIRWTKKREGQSQPNGIAME